MEGSGQVTLGFYDRDPGGYVDATMGLDLSDARSRFLRHLDPGARILDLGSGSCRDTVAFRAEEFDAVPVDGSEGLCREAEARLGIRVLNLRFDELPFVEEFDGVWASASLLHVPSEDLPSVLLRIRRALVPGGVLYCSFKDLGQEGYRDGRWYRDLDPAGLRDVLEGSWFVAVDLWRDTDAVGTPWSNAVAVRQRYDSQGTWAPHEVQKPAEEEEGRRQGRYNRDQR